MMNLIGSHDVERVLTLLGEAPYYEGMPAVHRGRFHLDNDHFNLGVARLNGSAVADDLSEFPCVYYGDESGMQGYRIRRGSPQLAGSFVTSISGIWQSIRTRAYGMRAIMSERLAPVGRHIAAESQAVRGN